jgi:hypothetical protein
VRAAGRADWLLFVELPPADLGLCAFPTIDVRALGGGVVHAPHWYDQLTLFLGRFVPFAAIDVQSGAPHFGAASVSRITPVANGEGSRRQKLERGRTIARS